MENSLDISFSVSSIVDRNLSITITLSADIKLLGVGIEITEDAISRLRSADLPRTSFQRGENEWDL